RPADAGRRSRRHPQPRQPAAGGRPGRGEGASANQQSHGCFVAAGRRITALARLTRPALRTFFSFFHFSCLVVGLTLDWVCGVESVFTTRIAAWPAQPPPFRLRPVERLLPNA